MKSMTIKAIVQKMLLSAAMLMVLSAQASEHVTYYVNDALGSPIMAMDEQGAVVWQESYQPYGQRQVKPAAANYDEQFYTGKQEEPDIGLQYFGARWYDPEAGRFTSIDPVGVQEGEIHSFNRYAYANNNPYRFTDPNGESPLDVAFFAIDALAFGVAVASGNPQAIGSAGTDLAMSAIGLISPVPGTGQALKMVKAGKALEGLQDASSVSKYSGRIVLGEDMTRVRAAAKKLRAETFEGKGMDANRAWLKGKLESGYEVFDVGPAFNRRIDRYLKGKRPDSPFYGMERQETKGYAVNKLWDRSGKWEGGSKFIGE